MREATSADETFLFEVYASTRREELEGLGWDENQKHAFIKMQFIARERTYPKVDNRIILLDSCAIGRVLVDRNETAILLVDIALLTNYRNAGIGSRVIKDLQNESVASGKPIKLHVSESSPALRLYERLGFYTIGTDAAYSEMIWTPPVAPLEE